MTRKADEHPEEALFFRRWLANPMKVGAVLPSSSQLARLVARRARPGPGQCIVELGPGTGPVTRALLEGGVPANRLFVVEIDAALCGFLRREFPDVAVIQGDARNLPELLPPEWVGKVACVVSGIPMLPLPIEVQRDLTRAAFAVMAPGGEIVQYTYSPASPIKTKPLGLKGHREGWAILNFPPAWVWTYLPEPAPATA
ncbi:MAG: methyltransferase domain-containing protein [Rhodospirillales bacterium]|nr:methyltransferase domain-containing protein [Rhodospirillales bacterium]